MYGTGRPKHIVYRHRSNRQRMREADAAVAGAQVASAAHAKDRTVLLAVLAQSGSEVVVTNGTIMQLKPEMSYEIVDSAPGEKTIRLLFGTEPPPPRVTGIEVIGADPDVFPAERTMEEEVGA